jgi:hypothetical protein
MRRWASASGPTRRQASSIALGSVPMASDSEVPFWVVGQPPPTEQAHPWSLIYMVSADYRPAFGLTLLRGRFITPEDTENAPNVVVIDEELARAAFGSKDPIGEQLHLDVIDTDYRVVGVVGHVRQWGSTVMRHARAVADVPVVPTAARRRDARRGHPVGLGRAEPLPRGVLAEQIRRTVYDFSPTMTVFNVRTMEEIIDGSLAERRLARLLLGSFAGLALLLAAVGIYGVMSQFVLQSTHDLGVRMAVGASPGAVLTMVLASAARMALAGIAVGAVLTAGVTQLMGGLLYGVTATDPITFAWVAACSARWRWPRAWSRRGARRRSTRWWCCGTSDVHENAPASVYLSTGASTVRHERADAIGRHPVDQRQQAYERLIAPLETRMIRAIWRIVGNPDDAEDALQDALTVTWRRWDRLQAHPNTDALILRSAQEKTHA